MPNLSTYLSHFRPSSPLSFRLLAYILLFSSVFTLISSAFQVYSDFRNDVSLVDERMSVIETSYASSLASSLWALDQKLLQIQMEGILSLPDIVHLRLHIQPDSEIVMGKLSEGIETKTHGFKLYHKGETVSELGKLTITASFADIYKNLRRKVVIILTTQFLKTLMISLLIIWIFRHLVTRHLSRMADYASRFSLRNANEPLCLDRRDTPANRQDELGQVVEAFNTMRLTLQQDMQRQEDDASEIQKLSKAIEQSPSSVMICDRHWHIEYVNQKFSQLTGFQLNEIQGKHPGTLSEDGFSRRESQQLWQKIRLQTQRVGVWQGEVNSARRSGERFWEQIVVTPIRDAHGSPTHYLILGEDISIRKRYEQQLLRQANYDVLTGLPNRMLAMDRLKLALAQARRENTLVGVMFLDLDNFKHINDTMGHEAGDNLLVEASRRISTSLRGTSTVARLGGDEFLVVLPGLQDPISTVQVAERILQTFAPPFLVTGQEVFVSTSIGISIYPTDSETSSDLLQHADAAMYEAKNKGKSAYERFAPVMTEASHERLQIESNLRRALEFDEFELLYQPIVETGTGKIVAAEALIRWHSTTLGLVMPDKFIPLAEETGLITPIGNWVIHQACAAARDWEKQTGLQLTIAVNVSPRQFRDPKFVASVQAAITTHEIDARCLELEITERLILDNTIETADILKELDEMGVRLSVDDFGTGYSALSYLKSYPFDTLKIDKSFIRDVITEKDDTSLVTAIINMAHSLKLEVIAEGVEEASQTHFLKAKGCDYAQGYLYSRPISHDAFIDWVRENMKTSR